MSFDDFLGVKIRCNGMLTPEVYREIRDTATLAQGHAVEVGTAHGASAVSAALGLAPHLRVHTIDKIVGGSRDEYGGIAENEKIIHDNFRHFGLTDRIRLHIGRSSEVAGTLDTEGPIGMLILDADGAIDRDLALFYDRLRPGAPIVIDDYGEGVVNLSRRSNGAIFVDQKFRLTAALVTHFEQGGFLVRRKLLKNTWFGEKPQDAPAFAADHDQILQIYRSLTFAETRLKNRLAEVGDRWLARRFPRERQKLKELLGRSRG